MTCLGKPNSTIINFIDEKYSTHEGVWRFYNPVTRKNATLDQYELSLEKRKWYSLDSAKTIEYDRIQKSWSFDLTPQTLAVWMVKTIQTGDKRKMTKFKIVNRQQPTQNYEMNWTET